MIDQKALFIQTTLEYLNVQECLPPLTKTKLLKLVYLIEYKYFKRYRTRLSNINWVYYLYGPYSFDYDNVIKKFPFEIEKNEGSEGFEFEIIKLDEDFALSNKIDEFDIRLLVKNVVNEFGSENISDLLDFIYFETEPMQFVAKRHDPLDFETIQEEEKVIKQNLDLLKIKEILIKHKGALASARRL